MTSAKPSRGDIWLIDLNPILLARASWKASLSGDICRFIQSGCVRISRCGASHIER